MDYLAIGFFSVVIIALLAGLLAVWSNNKKRQAARTSKQSNMQPVKCPVCQSELFVGEQLISNFDAVLPQGKAVNVVLWSAAIQKPKASFAAFT